MAWIKRCKQKQRISKISADSNSTFSSYAWSCVFHCSHRLLCWIKSRVRDFLWKLLSFHTEMVPAQFLWGNVLLRGELQKYATNSKVEIFESALNWTSGSMPLIAPAYMKLNVVLSILIPFSSELVKKWGAAQKKRIGWGGQGGLWKLLCYVIIWVLYLFCQCWSKNVCFFRSRNPFFKVLKKIRLFVFWKLSFYVRLSHAAAFKAAQFLMFCKMLNER